MEGEPDYAMVPLALTSISTERRRQWMINGRPFLWCLYCCGVGFGGGGGRALELQALFGPFFVGNLLNSYIYHSIKLCMYVNNTKHKLTT
jgi:hypothetical protein